MFVHLHNIVKYIKEDLNFRIFVDAGYPVRLPNAALNYIENIDSDREFRRPLDPNEPRYVYNSGGMYAWRNYVLSPEGEDVIGTGLYRLGNSYKTTPYSGPDTIWFAHKSDAARFMLAFGMTFRDDLKQESLEAISEIRHEVIPYLIGVFQSNLKK